MPIREFICKNCGKKFDKLIERWDGRCPYCGSKKIEKKISTFSFRI